MAQILCDLGVTVRSLGDLERAMAIYEECLELTRALGDKPFARAVAEALAAKRPQLVVSNMKKSLRSRKVLVDWSQNDPHKTTVCVYSLRARERPTVSMPVTWDEVRDCLRAKDPSLLSFEADAALRRVERHGDLFAPLLSLKQKLPRVNVR